MSHNHSHDRVCAHCGNAFVTTDARKVYCTKACKIAFHAISRQRGQEIMAFLEAHAKHRHRKDEEGYELQKFARQQASRLIADYLAQDKKSGRDSSRVVKARMDGGILVMDSAGKKLGRIVHGAPATTNLAFGGDDWRTLYITSRNHLGAVKVKIPGIAVPVAAK